MIAFGLDSSDDRMRGFTPFVGYGVFNISIFNGMKALSNSRVAFDNEAKRPITLHFK